ncbi:MAG: hypothetical protein A2663_01770 [Candidatus Buchananbacteria bacterium RIFCSPHIGHO2_01_FULL_46_12]|uniref:Uncharacterized protein n=1 Tax=Candidatus Buchananbacteria bacterium RIFCSPHIGHO2_01_FULL_46_12 TaxID=1797536 RepID=A0A1G1YB31_9BACT|nr:MAG: hypothetical protein A2663_01770 [Candidatus Buchananbacteria bacterium RIFCSPHIGHO2_01_FULL_46_12]
MNKTKKFKGLRNFQSRKAAKYFLTLAVLFLALAGPASALDVGLQYGTYTGLGTQDIRVTVMRIVQIFLGLVGLIALILVIYAGYMYMTSAGNVEKIEMAKKTLKNAAIGLFIIFFAFAIVSFIIGVLTGALGGGGGQPPSDPPTGCENCGYLGGGIIESVYPLPNAKEVARNTSLMVTFKVPMDPGTIIGNAPATCSPASPCSGNLVSNNVKIYEISKTDAGKLGDTDVLASSPDGRTFVFRPVNYLGDGINNVWYAVKLTNGIEKDNNESAFPGAGGSFTWRFEIGSFLDLDPAAISNVFPRPDDLSDSYSTTAAVQAEGKITVTAQPNFAEAAAVTEIVKEVGPNLTIAGNYNCLIDTLVCISYEASAFAVIPRTGADCSSGASSGHGFVVNPVITNGALNLGCGLIANFSGLPAPETAGNLWHFKAIAAKTADTLTVDSKRYTFVNAPTAPGDGKIQVSTSLANTATAIAGKIQLDTNSLGVNAFAAGKDVTLTAKVAGISGNAIPISASGNWAAVTRMQGGAPFSYRPTTQDAPDQPRNAVVSLTFSEPINVSEATADTVKVEYDNGGAWTPVLGKYLYSNNYQTVEFLSDNACTDGSGNPIINSCGEKIYCLPTIEPAPYKATHYRVTVKAGLLKTCTADSECLDQNYKICADLSGGGKACQMQSGGQPVAFYPEAHETAPLGIVDAANNSFNGNKNTYIFNNKTFGQAEGPKEQSSWEPYSLNDKAANTGDDLVWEFYINKNIDLAGPTVETIQPNIVEANISLTAPATAEFKELLMSATLKPGSNYRDGQCSCAADDQCPAGQTCDSAISKCKSSEGEQAYCLEDKECPKVSGQTPQCVNKKYVSLINRSAWQVGWWVAQAGIDTSSPLDEYADKTKAYLEHTRLAEITNYGAELGSGIKDIYQNCFLPSEGPGKDSAPVCGTDAGKPYCCNGAPMDKAAWAGSECFTGY